MVDVKSTHWGTYILTLNQDHLEIAGMQPGTQSHVCSILTDNLRVDELRVQNGVGERSELKFAF